MDYREHLELDARLVILRELAAQRDGRLSQRPIERVLDVFGYRRTRDWVRTQLLAMETVGAITLTDMGSVLVAQITRAGRDHVEMRGQIAGIAEPWDGA